MNTAKKWIAYIAYILGLTLFFLYVLFPGDAVRRYVESRANEASADVRIRIDELQLALPPGLSLRNIDVTYDEMPPFRVDQAEVTPGYWSLLGAQPTLFVKGEMAGGEIDGSVRFHRASGNIEPVAAKLSADGLGLDAIPAMDQLTQHKLTGSVSATVDYAGGVSKPGSGAAQMNVSDFAIALNPPLFGVERLAFSQVSADIDIQNRRLSLKDISLKGDQLSGKGTGSLVLSMPLQNSRINLTGTITPHPSLLKSIGGVFPKRYMRDGRVPVRISGTLGHPRLSLQ